MTNKEYVNLCKNLYILFKNENFISKAETLETLLAKKIFAECIKQMFSREEFYETLDKLTLTFEYQFQQFKPADFFKCAPKLKPKQKNGWETIEIEEDRKTSIHFLLEEENYESE